MGDRSRTMATFCAGGSEYWRADGREERNDEDAPECKETNANEVDL